MIKEASAKSKLIIFSLIILLMLLFHVDQISAQTQPAKVIPEFTFYTLKGQPFTQQQLKEDGKILFLFFDATCPHCQYETQLIASHYKDFKNTAFYLVSMDKKFQIENFVHHYGKAMEGKSNVTLLADVNRQFIQKFMPLQFPALYIYDKERKLLKYWDTPVNIDQIFKCDLSALMFLLA